MLEITLPWPPSVNRYWRSIDGRAIISAEGRAYREAAMFHIQQQKAAKRIAEPIRVVIEAYRPDKRRRDLDNLFKATLDSLAHGGVYNDDAQIQDLRIYWAPTIGGMLKIKIEVIE